MSTGGRSRSVTDIALNRNLRGNLSPEMIEARKVRERPSTGINRSNTGRVLQDGESRNPTPPLVDDFIVQEPSANPGGDLQQYQQGVQKAGINWLLPLLIIGGFAVATKLKKKQK